jgi:hypothetical protein
MPWANLLAEKTDGQEEEAAMFGARQMARMEHELMSTEGFAIAQGEDIAVNTVAENSAEAWLRFLGSNFGGKYLDIACAAAKKDGYRLIEVFTIGDFELLVKEIRGNEK